VESVSLLPVIADLAGAAIARRLAGENYEVLVANRDVLDLSDQRATENWLERARPDANFLAAGLVGGIHANNNYPADFVANNLAIALNVIRSAYTIGVKNYSSVTRNMSSSR
jgi:GDP-L-fucose synthase